MAGKPQKDTRDRYAMIAEYWQTQESPIAEVVAPALGVTVHQVYRAVRFYGISSGKGGPRKIPYEQIEQIYLTNRSQKQTAMILGVHESTVGRALDVLGYGSRRKGYQICKPSPLYIVRARNENGESIGSIAKSFGIAESVLRRRMIIAEVPMIDRGQQRGEESVLYNGGEKTRTVKDHKEARSLGAACLGRTLERGEVVHHHDFDPSNNAIENLWYFPTASAHSGYHNRLKRLRREGIEVQPNQIALEIGGVPLLQFAAQNALSPDKDLLAP
jgi:hypothetical protein